jgi:hypothetical protein
MGGTGVVASRRRGARTVSADRSGIAHVSFFLRLSFLSVYSIYWCESPLVRITLNCVRSSSLTALRDPQPLQSHTNTHRCP